MADEPHVLRPKGRLDSSTGPAFESELLQLINAGVGRLLLDFSELVYISSAGLRVVLLTAKRLRSANGRLALCSLNPQITEVFRISGFDTILDIHPSSESALTRLAST